MKTLEILENLIAFPTESARSNLDLVDYCKTLLSAAGATIDIIPDDTGEKASLFATIGPTDRAGVVLSGHTDVVPVAGQSWTKPPFRLTEEAGKLFGRGTTDMKGFVACALAATVAASKRQLVTPLHLALSYDEEIGCVGVRPMLDKLASDQTRARYCIVGEPTQLSIATAHKGKTAIEVTCTGREGHSAMAPTRLNAIHMACDVISDIRALQAEIAENTTPVEGFDIPYSTLHVGQISGGTALNIVPNHAAFQFEIRCIPGDSPDIYLDRLKAQAKERLAALQDSFPEARIEMRLINEYPALGTDSASDVVAFARSLTPNDTTTKVAFGTEAGLFSTRLGVPTVVCGPGSMAQGHRPDEFIAKSELDQCDQMLGRLLDRLETAV